MIQKYIVHLKDWGRTGDVYQAEQPTTPEPTTAEPTTVKPTTQPTTKPADTYTLYFKTKLGWMTSDGVSLFAYDLDTGASYQLSRIQTLTRMFTQLKFLQQFQMSAFIVLFQRLTKSL